MPGTTTAKRRNTALFQRRNDLGLSHEKLAHKICIEARSTGDPVGTPTSVTRHVKRIEAGEIANPSGVYRRLIAQVLRCPQAELFGELASDGATVDATLAITSHKFVPTFIGPDRAGQLADALGIPTGQAIGIGHEHGGAATLHVYPWGVAMAHLVERLELANIADLARWRLTSYPRDMAWLSGALSELLGRPVDASYVLSVYWLDQSPWAGEQLASAVQLLSMPRVLLGEAQPEQAVGAEQCEAVLLRDGFSHPDIVLFGVPGTSLGAASWSSVAYHPLVPARALELDDLISVELLTQAVWCYARSICDRVEAGQDFELPDEFGIRFLRAMRSRCFTARPQESSAHRSMREAIVHTSGLADQIDAAIAAIRDT